MSAAAPTGPATFDGFVRADGDRLADGAGRRLQWRGMGLGNWLLPEGYMWGLHGGPQSPRAIEAMIITLVGASRAEEFWTRFRDVFITEADIARMAAEGFDHVRLAINSRVVMADDGTPLPAGLALVDRLIQWCRTHRLWVVLDLHGAPGGQTGTEIDDSPRGRPELFEDARYRELTIELWTMLARRYRDETVVAGYDLLNEPLPGDYQHRYGTDLARLYQDLTTAIRAVDPHHLIIYEGSNWATNWDVFTEVWDTNSMLEFHKYWSPPDRHSIRDYLAARDRLGLPIYMGEGGENALEWFQTTFQLLEDHEIGWNFWPWKKIDTATSPCSIDPPDGWSDIVSWAKGAAPQPASDDAWKTLDDLLDRMAPDRCTYRPEVVDAMMRRVPIRLPATGFTFDGTGFSPSPDAETLPAFRAADAVTIRFRGDDDPAGIFDQEHRRAAGHLVVVLGASDWVNYDLTVMSPAVLLVDVEAEGDTLPRLTIDAVELTPTGERGRFITPEPIPAGPHRLRATAGTDRTTLVGLTVTTAP